MYSKLIAYLLWLFSGCGWLGFHRFYLGKPVSGVLWILTGGLFGLGSIYDLVTLGNQVDLANLRLGFPPDYAAAYPFGGTRVVHDATVRVVRNAGDPEQAALRVAKRNKGVVSAADLALEAGVGIDKAKSCLETMTAKGHAEMRIRPNGAIVFTINEFMEDGGGFEA